MHWFKILAWSFVAFIVCFESFAGLMVMCSSQGRINPIRLSFLLFLIIVSFVIGGIIYAAHAQDLICRTTNKSCVCFESLSPKGVLGYAADEVAVTCINMDTMARTFYTARREDASASYASAATAHNP